MPGRPRKPTKLHIIEGTLRPERHKGRENELDLSGSTPFPDEPPQIIADDPIALQEWARLVLDPSYAPVLSAVFVPLVTEYCLAVADLYRSYTGGPPVVVSARSHLNMLRIQLGLSPASQSKIKLPPKAIEANEFDCCDIPAKR